MVPMNDIYEEAAQVSDVTEATVAGIRGVIHGTLDREIHLSWIGTFVEACGGPSPELICYTLKGASCK